MPLKRPHARGPTYPGATYPGATLEPRGARNSRPYFPAWSGERPLWSSPPWTRA